MITRPAITLLLLTAQRLVRADFSGRGKPLGLYQEPRPELDDAPSLVEAALSLGPKCGRKTWVLSADLWTQTITMPARTVSKLSPEDLSRALGFELETLSGSNALEAQVGQAALPIERQDERAYWVVQAPTADRDMIDELLRRAGSRLMGIAHPGGVPRMLSGLGEPGALAPGASWQRIELWPDVIICLHGEAGQPARTHIINGDPKQERWRAEEEAWRSRVGKASQREMLLSSGELVVFDETNQLRLRQEEGQALQALLDAWAEELVDGGTAVPLLKPAARPLSPAGRGLIAAGIAAVVALGCWGMSLYETKYLLEPVKAESARLRIPIQAAAALDQQAAKLGKDRVELLKQRDALKQDNEALLVQRQRLTKLFIALAAHQPTDLVVQKIDGELSSATIHGICLQESQANQLAVRLARALVYDWRVSETVLKAQQRLPEGGPFNFQLKLQMLDGVAPLSPGSAPAASPVVEVPQPRVEIAKKPAPNPQQLKLLRESQRIEADLVRKAASDPYDRALGVAYVNGTGVEYTKNALARMDDLRRQAQHLFEDDNMPDARAKLEEVHRLIYGLFEKTAELRKRASQLGVSLGSNVPEEMGKQAFQDRIELEQRFQQRLLNDVGGN